MSLTRRALPRLLAASVVVTAACGTPGGHAGPGGPATPVATTAVDGGGWFSYAPMSETAVATDGSSVAPPTTSAGAAMSPDEFWTVVDGIAGPDPETAAHHLADRLRQLGPERVAAFEQQFVEQMARANTHLHVAAAETIMGFTSDDVFVNFRTWVLYQGREVYDAFVEQPDSLAGHGPTDDEQIGMAEVLEFTPLEVWGQATGRDPQADGSGFPTGESVYGPPTGASIDRAELATRFPRLTAAYVGGDPSGGPAPVRTR